MEPSPFPRFLAIFYSSPFISPLGFALNTLASLLMFEGGPVGTVLKTPYRHVVEPEASAQLNGSHPATIAARPTCVRSKKAHMGPTPRFPSCSPEVLQATGLRSRDHRCGSPQPPAHPQAHPLSR